MIPKDAHTSAAASSVFYDPASYCAEESVGWLMKRVVLSIVALAERRLDLHGLTSAQWGPLLRLQKSGPSTVAELARWLQIDAGAMTRLLDRLEKKGLVRRVRSTSDRRVVQIELTPAGAAAIVEVPPVLSEVLNAHLAGFSKSEFDALKTALLRMAEAGEAMRKAADAPPAAAAANDRPDPATPRHHLQNQTTA